MEDEGLIALDISNRLEALGHTVVTVGNAKDALENAAQADIVLMDIRIDGPIDGIEAAAKVRAQTEFNVETMARRTLSLYESVLRGRKPA